MLALWKSCLGKGQANTVGWVRSDFCLLKPGTAGLVSCGFSMIMCLQVIHFQKQLRLAQPYLQISIFNEKILASMLSHRSQSTQLLLRTSCHRWMESGKKLRRVCCAVHLPKIHSTRVLGRLWKLVKNFCLIHSDPLRVWVLILDVLLVTLEGFLGCSWITVNLPKAIISKGMRKLRVRVSHFFNWFPELFEYHLIYDFFFKLLVI